MLLPNVVFLSKINVWPRPKPNQAAPDSLAVLLLNLQSIRVALPPKSTNKAPPFSPAMLPVALQDFRVTPLAAYTAPPLPVHLLFSKTLCKATILLRPSPLILPPLACALHAAMETEVCGNQSTL
jgi:hypothetical protein